MQAERDVIANFFYPPEHLRTEDVVLAAMRQNGLLLAEAPEWSDEVSVAMTAVQQYGMALEFASCKMKDNEIIVLAALQRNGEAAKHSNKLQRT